MVISHPQVVANVFVIAAGNMNRTVTAVGQALSYNPGITLVGFYAFAPSISIVDGARMTQSIFALVRS